jgi:putative sigma-54 modulation protein
MNTQQINGNQATTVEVTAHGVEVVPAFREYIEEKVAELEKVWPRIDDAHINLHNERGISGAEITLVSGGLITRGEVRADDPRIAFDAALEKIETQLRRYKKKALSRERRHDNRNGLEVAKVAVQELSEVPQAEREEEHYDTRVRTKRFAVKPMSPDEAALQMDLLGHNFFVFRDAESNEVSVVYKRRSGGYGLLEPVVD